MNNKVLLSKIADAIGGDLKGKDCYISKIREIDKGGEESLSFIDNPIYTKQYFTTKCSALIVNKNFKESSRPDIALIEVDNARLGLLKAINFIYPQQKEKSIQKSSDLTGNIYGEFTYISDSAKIKNNVKIGHNCSINDNVLIGNNVIISHNVTIYDNVVIGDDTIIQSGAVIGSDGFGTVKEGDRHLNLPHIGKVILGKEVWIGSNTTIDRGSIGDTIIGDNTKIDNLIQIAHNVSIGKSCLIASGVAIAGTTIIGDNVSIGGQVGIVGHLSIGDNSIIGAQSLVTKSFGKGVFVSGNPARLHKDRIKQDIALRKLPNIIKDKKNS